MNAGRPRPFTVNECPNACAYVRSVCCCATCDPSRNHALRDRAAVNSFDSFPKDGRNPDFCWWTASFHRNRHRCHSPVSTRRACAPGRNRYVYRTTSSTLGNLADTTDTTENQRFLPLPRERGSIRATHRMTSESEEFEVGGPPDGPPWPVEFLAELHAGLYPDDPQLLGRVYADTEAVRVLDALEHVADVLRREGRRHLED